MSAQDPTFDTLRRFVRLLDKELALPYATSLSVKGSAPNLLGEKMEAIWVTVMLRDFASLTKKDVYVAFLDDIRMLEDRTVGQESLQLYMQRSSLVPGQATPPADTLLHGFFGASAVVITHPAPLMALAATERPKTLVEDVFGERVALLSCPPMNVAAAGEVARLARKSSSLDGVLLGGRGFLTWADSPEECLAKARALNAQVEYYFEDKCTSANSTQVQADKRMQPRDGRKILTKILPMLRGMLGLTGSGVLYVDNDSTSLQLLAQDKIRELALRMKGDFKPAWLEPSSLEWDSEALRSALSTVSREPGGEGGSDETHPASALHKRPIVLLPGLGVVSSGKSVSDAKQTAQFFKHLLVVAQGAETLGGFVAKSARGAMSGIESTRALEDQQIGSELSGRVAIVTGGASGIGRSIAARFASEGASVVVLDIDEVGAESVAEKIRNTSDFNSALALHCDVNDEDSVSAAFRRVVLTYGGVDVVVANAGIAISEAIEDTPLREWRRVQDVNLTGYFLTARESFRIFKAQDGGNLLFISSKAGLAAGPGSTAYGSSKAAELHLARILAEEGGPSGIRVNSICPDAVFQGSALWEEGWRQERARFYNIDPEEVEEHYRHRSALKLSIYPEDIAEAALFLVSDRSAKITGAILNVDGGVGAAYVR